jgi:FkbM family methyltransferase
MGWFVFQIAKIYAHLYIVVEDLLGIKIPGLGFILRRCKTGRSINFHNYKLYFEPTVASSYGLHIINRYHEPETHGFLNYLFDRIGSRSAYFIDVGANIGIFMVDLAQRKTVQVIGFEPSSGCVKAIKKTMALNNHMNFHVFNNLVGDTSELVPFDEGNDPQGASIYKSKNSNHKIMQVKIDDIDILSGIEIINPVVLMVDVEGYEPNVLRGGIGFIEKFLPLIIFEYNSVSKQYFNSQDIQNILGTSYKIYRLNKQSLLDQDIDNAWNCVAFSTNSIFYELLTERICDH